MEDKGKRVPEIRFPGFTDPWEQRKCGDVLTERNVQHPQNDEYPLVSFTVENGVTPKTERYEREQLVKGDKKAKNYKETRLNDIVYNPANLKFGAIARNTYGNAVFSPIYVTYKIDEALATPTFVEMYVTRETFIRNALQYQQGTVYERMAVSTEDFESLTILTPSIKEQSTIGDFFESIDNLITLHQRKCESIKKYKNGMLQKMFPQNGDGCPEIRFPGFTDSWKQRKLGDVAERVQRNDGRMNLPTLTISAANGWMSQENRFSGNIAGKEQQNYTLLHKGELSYNHGNSKLAKYGAVFALETYEEALVPRVYHSFRMIDADASFIEYYFATKIPDKELAKLISSGARMDGLLNISFDDFMGIRIDLPSVQEQCKISEFLRNLDNFITLHQHKIDELKGYKKGLLQRMFV